MNERDLRLVRVIDSEIEFEGDGPIYLLSAKYTNLVRVNLVVLKAFLDEKRKRGIIITIDRPHQYISHLLQLHGIDQTNLTYIDAISTHSSDTKGGAVATEFQKGPFQIETLPDFLFSDGLAEKVGLVDGSNVDFVVVDNVSTLLTYNTMDSVRKFFGKYVELVSKARGRPLATTLTMDKELFGELYGLVSGISRKIIDVGPDMTVMQVVGVGQQLSARPPVPAVVGNLSQPEFSVLRNDKSVM